MLNNDPPLTQPIVVYRGLDLDTDNRFHDLKVGQLIDVFKDNFNSTTLSPGISVKFSGNKCCLFIVHLPPGTK